MAYRHIIIESPAKLSVRHGQLIISTESEHSVPIEDISSVLIENRQTTISAAALSLMGERGCAVFICDEKHMPCAVTLPYSQHSRQLSAMRAQLSASEPLKKQLWKSVVTAKISNQAACLAFLGKEAEAAELYALASRVRSGDTDNTEAVAAAKYFPALFEKGFTRGADDGRNSALNYGYAIVRGCMARYIAVYGFVPSFGLHHCSELNSFNLADDLMEPFRPFVDLMTAMGTDKEDTLTPADKKRLYNVLNLDVLSGGQHHSLSYAMERTVQSLSRSFTEKKAQLVLPELCEIRQHAYE